MSCRAPLGRGGLYLQVHCFLVRRPTCRFTIQVHLFESCDQESAEQNVAMEQHTADTNDQSLCSFFPGCSPVQVAAAKEQQEQIAAAKDKEERKEQQRLQILENFSRASAASGATAISASPPIAAANPPPVSRSRARWAQAVSFGCLAESNEIGGSRR